MTVHTADLAFANLGSNGDQIPAATRHRSDITKFVPCHVIELENYRVILTAIDA